MLKEYFKLKESFLYKINNENNRKSLIIGVNYILEDFLTKNVVSYNDRFVYSTNIKILDETTVKEEDHGIANIVVEFNHQKIVLEDFLTDLKIIK